MRLTKNNNAFTVVELLIVIVVIALLATVVIVTYRGVQDRSKAVAKMHDIQAIQDAIEGYFAATGSYPSTGSAWKYQRKDGNAFIPGLYPTYMPEIPSIKDGPTDNLYNNTYIYISNGSEYKLDRLYQASVPSGEFSNIPTRMRDNSFTDRWGVWSEGGYGF